jgi:hypothetical protein
MEQKKQDADILKDHFSADETDFDRQLAERQAGWKSELIPFSQLATTEVLTEKEFVNVEENLTSTSDTIEISEIDAFNALSDAPDAVEVIKPKKRLPVAPKPTIEHVVPQSDPNYTRQIIEQQTSTPHVRTNESDAFPVKYITNEIKPTEASEAQDLIDVFGSEKNFLVESCGKDIDKVIERIQLNARLVARYKMQESADRDYLNDLIAEGNYEDRKVARGKLSTTYRKQREQKEAKPKDPAKAICMTIDTLVGAGWTAEKIKEKLASGNKYDADAAYYIDKSFAAGAK